MRVLFLQIWFLLLPVLLFAQPAIDWEQNHGGAASDKARCIKTTSDGGYILAGGSGSNSNDVSGNNGSWDVWVAKLDSAGGIVWEQNYGGPYVEDAHSIQETMDQGFIIAGRSKSASGDVSGNYGGSDYWVLKIDSLGNIEWEQNYGGSSYDLARSVRQTDDTGYVVTGSSYSSDFDVSGNNGQDDFWTIKLDSSGNLMWEQNYGGSSYEGGHSVEQTPDGGYITAGYVNSSNGDVSNLYGSDDYWVVKLDSTGLIEWERNYGGTGSGSARSIEVLPGGGYILAGSSSSSDYDVSANHGQEDYWVAELDPSGNIVWEQNYGGSGNEECSSIGRTSDGGYLLFGYSTSNDVDVSGNHGGQDYWAVKMDANGNIQWEKNYGGSNTEESVNGYLIQEDQSGSFLLAGFSASSDNDVSNNHGSNDYWTLKLFGPCDTIMIQDHPQPDSVCEGDTAMFVTSEGSYYNRSYEWQFYDGSGWNTLSGALDDTLELPSVTAADSGNLYRCVVSDPCGDSDTTNAAELTVSNSINFSTSVQDVSCNGYSDGAITVGPSGGIAPYRISLNGGTNFSGYSSSSQTFSGLSTGTYEVMIEDTLGCQSSITIDTILEPLPVVADAGLDDTICSADSATLGGSPTASGGTAPYTYAWTPVDGLGSVAVSDPKASPDSDTIYQVTVTDNNGCADLDSVRVSVRQGPAIDLGVDTALCGTTDTLTLSVASGYSSYQWSTGSNTPSTSLSTVGSVWVSVLDSYGCSGSDTLPVGRDTSTRAVLLPNAQAIDCFNGGNVLLRGDSSRSGTGPLDYQWSTANGSISGNTGSDSAIAQDSGTYKLRVQDQSTGCKDSAYTTLSLDTSSPNLSLFQPNELSCDQDSVRLKSSASSNTGASLRYNWITASGATWTGFGLDSINVGEAGEQELIVTDTSNGCKENDRVQVSGGCGELKVYNAFSPDGDGSNDNWWIEGIEEFPENRVRIMNRWGDEVRRFEGYDNQEVVWEGKSRDGNSLPAGTYFYVIELGEGETAKSGWIQLTK